MGYWALVRRVYQLVGRHTMGYWALSGVYLLVGSTHNGLLGFVRRVYQLVGLQADNGMGYWALSGVYLLVGLHTMGYWALTGESISLLVYTQWATGLCQESLSACWSTHKQRHGLLGFDRRVYQLVGLHTMGYWALSGESISLLVYTQWATGLCQESLSACWSTHKQRHGLLGFVSLLVYTQWATGLCQECLSACWSTHKQRHGLLGFVRKEGSVLFNNALNTFAVSWQFHGERTIYMPISTDDSGMPTMRPISSKGSFVRTIP